MRRNQFFRNMDRFEQFVNVPRYDRSRPRRLDQDAYEDFDRAGDIRRNAQRTPSVTSVSAARKRLIASNFIRFMRLRSDIKWAKRELRKMGRSPDDIWSVFDGTF